MVAATGELRLVVATFQPERNKHMSPQAGAVLVQEVAPRLRSAIPHCVKTVGAEDGEELVQDTSTIFVT
jgi:hypothetical protein